MSTRRAFLVNCDTLGTVELETENWKTERDSGNVVIHYRAQCECGNEHFGSIVQRLKSKSTVTLLPSLARISAESNMPTGRVSITKQKSEMRKRNRFSYSARRYRLA
jgi:hypothetical protein